MTVKVLFFSLLRDLAGADEVDWEIPEEGLAVSILLEQLYARWPAMREWDTKLLIAADLDYVDRDSVLKVGQEVAVMPPVQGG